MPNPQSPSPAPQPQPTAAADPLGNGDVGADPLGGGLGDAAMNAPLGTAGQQGYSPTLQSNRPKAKPKTNWKNIAIIGGSVVGVFALLGVAGVVVSVVMGTNGGDDTSTQVADTTNAAYSASPSSTADSDAAASDSGSYEEWTPDRKLVAELQEEVEFELPSGRWAIRLPKGIRREATVAPINTYGSEHPWFGKAKSVQAIFIQNDIRSPVYAVSVSCPQQSGPFQHGYNVHGDVRVSTLHEWMNVMKKNKYVPDPPTKFLASNDRDYLESLLSHSTVYQNDLFAMVTMTPSKKTKSNIQTSVEQRRAVVSTLRLVRRADTATE